jgi:hypothetical protein
MISRQRPRRVDPATASRIDAHVQRILDDAPMPTDQQLALLRQLLRGTGAANAAEPQTRRSA